MSEVLKERLLSDPTIQKGVLSWVKEGKGWLKLNRPQALNSLSPAMMKDLHDIFSQWALDEEIKAVVIRGEGNRAFCAGGDLRDIYDAMLVKDFAFLERLFRIEYCANIRLKAFPKPYIALLQGYVMGGGIGTAIHGSHRVVTDTTLMAMPETGIGYFPDVGASYFLNQCPGFTGLYLGLTGNTIKGEDGLYTRWATHFVPFDKFEALEKALQESEDVEGVVENFSRRPKSSALQRHEEEIEHHFCYESIEEIFESLACDHRPFAQETLSVLKKRSPLSLKVSFEQLRSVTAGVRLPFAAIMASEYHLSQVFVHTHDFQEGIRAAIIDKDRCPRWQHSSIYQVTRDDLAPFFAQGDKRFQGLLS